MSDQGGWAQPPSGEHRTFDTTSIVQGAVLGVVLTVGLTFVSFVAGPLLLPVGLLGALVVGIVLAAMPGTPNRRGVGLGLVIGWGLALVVGGGLCFVLLWGA